MGDFSAYKTPKYLEKKIKTVLIFFTQLYPINNEIEVKKMKNTYLARFNMS